MFHFRFEFAAGVADDDLVQDHGLRGRHALGVCSDGHDCPRLLRRLWDSRNTDLAALLQTFWGLL